MFPEPDFDINDFDIKIPDEEPVYVLSVVSKLVHIQPWTLRALDKEGVVCPRRKGRKKRLYSKKDLRKLEYVHFLMKKKGVNIQGIKLILELEEK